MIVLKWIKCSIAYPLLKYDITQAYEKMTREQRDLAFTNWLTDDHWSKQYWFGRAIELHVAKNLICK